MNKKSSLIAAPSEIRARGKDGQAYSEVLASLVQTEDVLWFRADAVKLRLADNTFYTPNFAVMTASGQLEMHEVKGFWTGDDRAKIKTTAEMYPFRFLAVTRAPEALCGWEFESFGESERLL